MRVVRACSVVRELQLAMLQSSRKGWVSQAMSYHPQQRWLLFILRRRDRVRCATSIYPKKGLSMKARDRGLGYSTPQATKLSVLSPSRLLFWPISSSCCHSLDCHWPNPPSCCLSLDAHWFIPRSHRYALNSHWPIFPARYLPPASAHLQAQGLRIPATPSLKNAWPVLEKRLVCT